MKELQYKAIIFLILFIGLNIELFSKETENDFRNPQKAQKFDLKELIFIVEE